LATEKERFNHRFTPKRLVAQTEIYFSVISQGMSPTKAISGHIILGDQYSYKNLLKVYPDIYRKVAESGGAIITPEDTPIVDILLDENLKALKADKKPAGFNRFDAGGVRLIFPIRDDDKIEFYVSKPSRCPEVVGLTESISTMLKKAGLKHTTAYDHTPLSSPRSSFPPPQPIH